MEPRDVLLENAWLRLAYHLEGGSFDVEYKKGEDFRIEGASLACEVDGLWLRTQDSVGDWRRAEFEDELGRGIEANFVHCVKDLKIFVTFRLYQGRPSLIVRTVLKNEGASSIRVGDVRPVELARGGTLALGRGLESSKILVESNSLSWTGVKDLGGVEGEEPRGDPSRAASGPNSQVVHKSGGMSLIYNPTSNFCLLAGFITAEVALTGVITAYREGIEEWYCFCEYEGIEIEPGGQLQVETLYLDFREDPFEALETYGDVIAAVNHLPKIEDTPLLWCSWYSHRLTITEDAVLENAEVMAERFKPYGVDTLQVDYGWGFGDTPGEWRAHPERFPHGMGWLSQKLKERGLKLGLWICPFLIGEKSSFFREHPDCLLKVPGSEELVRRSWRWNTQPRDTWQEVYSLDTIRPESQEWLRGVFKEMSSWGVGYFKLDFLASGSPEPPPGSPHYGCREGERVRAGLSVIREAVGEDAYLLGCNLPITHGIGMLSAIFVALDVGNATGNYEHLKGRMTTLISRYWQQKRLWHNDPDVLTLSGAFLDRGSVCDVGEARIRTTCVALSGGPVLLGDDLPSLPEERLRMMTLCLPSYGVSARPVDLFRSEYPRVWDLEVVTDWGGWHVVGLFNYDGEDRTVQVDFEDLRLDPDRKYLVWEFWEEEFLGTHAGKVKVIVPKQSARVLAIRELTDRPAVLSTDLHITQGGVELEQVEWDEGSATLRGLCRRAKGAEGSIFLYLPDGYRVERGGEIVGPNVARIGLSFSEPSLRWEVKFHREASTGGEI